MIQLATTPPDDQILFDDQSARTDFGFWNSVFRQRFLTRALETSTAPLPMKSVKDELKEMFNKEWEEVFEDGFESEFTNALRSIILEHGEPAVDALMAIVFYDRVNKELASEALELLGRTNDKPSYQRRLWLLESALFSNSARIRDAASLGLASIDNPHAIPYIRRAIEEERSDELREDLEQVLEQLQETQRCR